MCLRRGRRGLRKLLSLRLLRRQRLSLRLLSRLRGSLLRQLSCPLLGQVFLLLCQLGRPLLSELRSLLRHLGGTLLSQLRLLRLQSRSLCLLRRLSPPLQLLHSLVEYRQGLLPNGPLLVGRQLPQLLHQPDGFLVIARDLGLVVRSRDLLQAPLISELPGVQRRARQALRQPVSVQGVGHPQTG